MAWDKEDLRVRVKALIRYCGMTEQTVGREALIQGRELRVLMAHGGSMLIDVEAALTRCLVRKAAHMKRRVPTSEREKKLIDEIVSYLQDLAK